MQKYVHIKQKKAAEGKIPCGGELVHNYLPSSSDFIVMVFIMFNEVRFAL